MLKRTPPDWNDENGVADLASAIIAREKAIADVFEAYGDEVADFHARERIAVEAALQGDVAALAALLQDAEWHWLQAETRQLMHDIMLGRHRRGRGRPKLTLEHRAAVNPIHRAAGAANILVYQFRRLYPEQRPAARRARAIAIAATWTGVEPRSLRQHLDRSRRSPHRIA